MKPPKRNRQIGKKQLKASRDKVLGLLEEAQKLAAAGKAAGSPEIQDIFAKLDDACRGMGPSGNLMRKIVAAVREGTAEDGQGSDQPAR